MEIPEQKVVVVASSSCEARQVAWPFRSGVVVEEMNFDVAKVAEKRTSVSVGGSQSRVVVAVECNDIVVDIAQMMQGHLARGRPPQSDLSLCRHQLVVVSFPCKQLARELRVRRDCRPRVRTRLMSRVLSDKYS